MVESCEKKFERWRRKGDTDALADVFDAIAPRLLRLAIHLVGDVAAAEDLVQSTFVTAIEDASTWDPSRPLEPWLTGILDNRAKRLRKSRERPLERAAREDIDHDTPLTRAMESETSTEITKAIDQLDEPYRSVMVLSLLHHLEPAAIAHALDRSPGAVRVQLHRGREMVRKVLPAGVLTSAALLASSGRGLAAIKSAVLAHSGGAIAVHVSATTGALIMSKKLSLAIVLVALVAVGLIVATRSTRDAASDPKATAVALDADRTERSNRETLDVQPGAVTPRQDLPAAAKKLVVFGRVVNAHDGAPGEVDPPAAGCSISLTVAEPAAKPAPPLSFDTQCDDQGRFRFEVEDPPWPFIEIWVTAHADDMFCKVNQFQSLRAPAASAEDLVLKREVRMTLRGIVTDAHDAPLAEVPVQLMSESRSAPPLLQVVSDSAGRFEMRPQDFGRAHFVATKPGFSMFEIAQAERDPHGGWKDATVVLAPRGRLRLHVQDAGGNPIPDQQVFVEAAPNEPRRQVEFPTTHGFAAVTDASGTVTFDDLWIGKRLKLQTGRGAFEDVSEYMHDGQTVLGDDATGEPIVIGAGGVLDLIARFTSDLVIHGVVMRTDRSPVPGAYVEIRTADEPYYSSLHRTASAVADGVGRFELRMRSSRASGRLRVVAADHVWKHRQTVLDDIETLSQAANVSVLAGELDPKRELELILEPLGCISGRVSDVRGEPVWTIVSAVPAGSASSHEESCAGHPAFERGTADGTFRLPNLTLGRRYDLVVQLVGGNRSVFPLAVQRYPGIEAGSNVNLVFDVELGVRVHVQATSKYGAVKSIEVLRGRDIDRSTTPSEGHLLPLEMTVHSMSTWPRSLPAIWGDIRGQTDPLFSETYDIDRCKDSTHDIAPMQEGWTNVGVMAKMSDGRNCFPMSTGRVYFGPGNHTITFDVVPVTDVEGRVLGLSQRSSHEIALVDESGGLLPLRGRNLDPSPLLPCIGLRDDGWFQIADAPLGTFRLRIGTRAQLEAGEFLFERAIEIVENGPPLSIDVTR